MLRICMCTAKNVTICVFVLWQSLMCHPGQCQRALGMQSGQIPDSAIRASSSYDDVSVGPANGRSVYGTIKTNYTLCVHGTRELVVYDVWQTRFKNELKLNQLGDLEMSAAERKKSANKGRLKSSDFENELTESGVE
jgi:hypothetical protein